MDMKERLFRNENCKIGLKHSKCAISFVKIVEAGQQKINRSNARNEKIKSVESSSNGRINFNDHRYYYILSSLLFIFLSIFLVN